jgi:hypothetical protein
MPAKNNSLISELCKSPSDLNTTNEYGRNKYFEFLALSCTKPSVKTEIFKVVPGAASSHKLIREGQSTTYEFAPVKVELIDTYDHDLASTLTAYLYAYGKITSTIGEGTTAIASEIAAANWRPGELIKFSNTPTHGEFHIYELLDKVPESHPALGRLDPPPFQGSFAEDRLKEITGLRARRWILKNPYLASIDFGTYNNGSQELSRVTVEIAYEKFDYDFVFHRSYAGMELPKPPASSASPGPAQPDPSALGDLLREQEAKTPTTVPRNQFDPTDTRDELGEGTFGGLLGSPIVRRRGQTKSNIVPGARGRISDTGN